LVHPNPNSIEQAADFCDRTGIIDLLGKIKDTKSYVFGAEVGLDSNARKNRIGHVFGKNVAHLLEIAVYELMKSGEPATYASEVELEELGVHQSEKKKVDFLIYQSGNPVVACEANVYNTQGSKPTEIIRSYAHLQSLLKQKNIELLWFTDGPAWSIMWSAFEDGVRNLDYVMNYAIATRSLPNILLHIIRR
jgi:type II restriction enzyme